jgi:hypothetical protein
MIGYTVLVTYLVQIPNEICILTWRYNYFIKSSKQTLTAISTNHSEIIALYEASHESV